jgi:uncharacterized protein YndB with AHSA1/START domain
MSSPSEGVEIRRRLRVSAEKVFDAFADAALVARWLRPSPDVLLTVLELDFREGGAYRFAYDVPGGRRMVVGGTYRSIERPTRIVFSWVIEPPDEHAGIDSEVTVTLMSSGNATELTIRHAKFDRADADARHTEGWHGALELLDTVLRAREA